MCCGTMHHHGSGHCAPHIRGHHHAGSCACGSMRRPVTPVTKEEQTARLERYLKSLQEKARAVEEQIATLKGAE